MPTLRVRSVAASGSDSTNLFTALESWGVFKSTDGALSWAPRGNSASIQDFRYTRLVVGDSTVSGRNYIVTLAGLFRTLNAAASEHMVLPDGFVTSASIAPNRRTAYPSAKTIVKIPDIYEPAVEATDVGASIPVSTLWGSVQVDANNPAVIYATTNNRGLYKSDSGANWTRVLRVDDSLGNSL